MPPSDHSLFFSALDQLLSKHVALWQIRSFHHRNLCWHDSKFDLCAALLDLDDDSLTCLESDDEALVRWLRPWLGSDADELSTLTQLAELPQRTLIPPPRFSTHIPGRKWQQIQALAALLPSEPRPLLEWCAGKGHLGRLLAVMDSRQVISLEHQADLCHQGTQAARHCGASVRFVQADALDPDSARWLPSEGHAVALHACGDLHTNLVRYWTNSDCRRLTLSPCCYHLIRDDHYQPLSIPAARSTLRLDRLDLHMAVRQVVTGGTGTQHRRYTEMTWRLAFDEWQREQRGMDLYLALPTFPKRLLSGRFREFCRWAALSRGLTFPGNFHEEEWLSRGRSRFRLTRLMELVGRPFRRPLELWLTLDQVLYLEERGAQVRIGTFCDRSLTPRNLVIDAESPS